MEFETNLSPSAPVSEKLIICVPSTVPPPPPSLVIPHVVVRLALVTVPMLAATGGIAPVPVAELWTEDATASLKLSVELAATWAVD